MSSHPGFLDRPLVFDLAPSVYRVVTLAQTDAPQLQDLYERCVDYAVIVDGEPPMATAAISEFTSVPDGKTTDDKYMFGVVHQDDGHRLVAVVESVAAFRDVNMWWIGLMMIDPLHRGSGLGRVLVGACEVFVARQGFVSIGLSVAEDNVRAASFWAALGYSTTSISEPLLSGSKTQRYLTMNRTLDGL